MAQAYYFACFVIAVIVNIIYFFKWHKHYSVYFTLLFIFVPIANLGYWQLSMADNLEQAILANKILYMGACYTILVAMLCVLFLCKIQIGKIVHVVFYVVTTTIYLASLTVGNSDIFYRSVSLKQVGDHYILVKEYGPVHTCFYIMIACYCIIAAAALIYAIRKKSDVSVKTTFLLLGVIFITVFSFGMGRAVGGVEMPAICYDISLILFLIVADRFALYDVDETVVIALMNLGSLGVASFDLKYNFLGGNDIAKKYYPPLQKLRVDGKLDQKDESFDELCHWLAELRQNKNSQFEYWNDGRFYKVTGQYLFIGSVMKGYHLLFRDYTEEKEHEEYLNRIAKTDEMTQVYNRRAYEEDVAVLREYDDKNNLVLITIDLNGLKTANDTMGHVAGDELIRAAARCLTAAIGQKGKVYRTGGDEFICIMDCNEEELQEILDNLRGSLQSWRGRYSDQITLSRGIATRREFPGYSVSLLKREADRRMYLDKEAYYKRTGIDRRR